MFEISIRHNRKKIEQILTQYLTSLKMVHQMFYGKLVHFPQNQMNHSLFWLG